MTYARRYSLAAMVGVVSGEDDDAHSSSKPGRSKGANIDKVKGPEMISAAERIAMKKVWTKAGKSDAMVMDYLKEAYEAEGTAQVKKSDYQDVMAWCAEPKPTQGV